MKFIIIFEDETRTLVFKSASRDEVDTWFNNMIKKIKQKGGEVYDRDEDVAWGVKDDGEDWKITIYADWEIDHLQDITI